MKVWTLRLKTALIRSTCQQQTVEDNSWSARQEIFIWVLRVGLFVVEGTNEAGSFIAGLSHAVAMNEDSARSAYGRFF